MAPLNHANQTLTNNNTDMVRFIHTADLHFGMENYGHIDATTGVHTRLLDFHRAFSICVDRAIADNVDFFVFAGDAYKTAHPSPTQQRLLMSLLLRLFHANIPVIIVIGNHDTAVSFGKAHALEVFNQLPVSGFHVIARPTSLRIMTKSGPVSIVGIPWPSRATVNLNQAINARSDDVSDLISSTLADYIADAAAQLDPTVPAVLVGHLTVSSGIFSGSEKRALYGSDPLFLPSQLALFPFDYVALGHLHRYQNLNSSGYPAVVYAGSIERIDFGERKEEKGFCLVTIPAKGRATHEFIKVPIRPFIQITGSLPKQDSPAGNNSEADTTYLLNLIQTYDLTDAVVKIIYHIPEGMRDSVDKSALHAACSRAHHIACIMPIKQITQRRTRVDHLSIDMSFDALINAYFAAKPEYQQNKERIVAKAQALLAEHELGKRMKEL